MSVIIYSRLDKFMAMLAVIMFSSASFGWAQVDLDQILKENKELKEMVTKLTQRVDGLEGRTSKTEAAVSGGMLPATQTLAPPTEDGHGVLLSKGGNIYMDGFIDTSFNWNLDSPGTGPQTGPAPAGTNATGNSTLRAFDRESDTFDLNNAQINFYRPAPADGGVGFRTEFMYGTDAQVVDSAGFDTADEFSIQEAFVDIKIPIGSGITVWAGKFATLHGAEVIENFVNWNSSRSLLFTNAEPATHTGIRATYNWLEGKIQTCLGLINGWDNAIDNNAPKDIEAMVKWIPNENFFIGENFMVGSQVADDRDRNRYLFDTVAYWKPLPDSLPKLSFMANVDYGFEELLGENPGSLGALNPEGGPAEWMGYALYAKYDITDKLTAAVRWEQFWDDQGVRTAGLVDDIWETTYTLDYKFWQNLIGRLEYRHDQVGNVNDVVSYRANPQTNVFDRGTDDSQDTVGFSLIYLFG